jgi:hypothetical protein
VVSLCYYGECEHKALGHSDAIMIGCCRTEMEPEAEILISLWHETQENLNTLNPKLCAKLELDAHTLTKINLIAKI